MAASGIRKKFRSLSTQGDLSRFGRDYIETGEYLEKIFPFLGIRFISITDGYDSLTAGDAEDALMIPLKNMINDVYAKDISRKIITVRRRIEGDANRELFFQHLSH